MTRLQRTHHDPPPPPPSWREDLLVSACVTFAVFVLLYAWFGA